MSVQFQFVAPTIINTFLESDNFTGKANEKPLSNCPSARLIEDKVLNSKASKAELSDWVDILKI